LALQSGSSDTEQPSIARTIPANTAQATQPSR
jgi:hypothetical protein